MPEKDPDFQAQVLEVSIWLFFAFIGMVGGIARYFSQVQNLSEKFVWSRLAMQAFISGFAGLVGGLLVSDYGLTLKTTSAISGLCGFGGAFALNGMLRMLSKK